MTINLNSAYIDTDGNLYANNYPVTKEIVCYSDNVGGANVTLGGAVIFNNIVYESNANSFTLEAATGNISVNKTGLYEIIYEISLGGTGTTDSRTNGYSVLQEDGDDGWSNVESTFAWQYVRNPWRGEDTATCTIFKQIESDNVYRIFSSRASGGDTSVETLAEASRILFKEI